MPEKSVEVDRNTLIQIAKSTAREKALSEYLQNFGQTSKEPEDITVFTTRTGLSQKLFLALKNLTLLE